MDVRQTDVYTVQLDRDDHTTQRYHQPQISNDGNGNRYPGNINLQRISDDPPPYMGDNQNTQIYHQPQISNDGNGNRYPGNINLQQIFDEPPPYLRDDQNTQIYHQPQIPNDGNDNTYPGHTYLQQVFDEPPAYFKAIQSGQINNPPTYSSLSDVESDRNLTESDRVRIQTRTCDRNGSLQPNQTCSTDELIRTNTNLRLPRQEGAHDRIVRAEITPSSSSTGHETIHVCNESEINSTLTSSQNNKAPFARNALPPPRGRGTDVLQTRIHVSRAEPALTEAQRHLEREGIHSNNRRQPMTLTIYKAGHSGTQLAVQSAYNPQSGRAYHNATETEYIAGSYRIEFHSTQEDECFRRYTHYLTILAAITYPVLFSWCAVFLVMWALRMSKAGNIKCAWACAHLALLCILLSVGVILVIILIFTGVLFGETKEK